MGVDRVGCSSLEIHRRASQYFSPSAAAEAVSSIASSLSVCGLDPPTSSQRPELFRTAAELI